MPGYNDIVWHRSTGSGTFHYIDGIPHATLSHTEMRCSVTRWDSSEPYEIDVYREYPCDSGEVVAEVIKSRRFHGPLSAAKTTALQMMEEQHDRIANLV